MNEEYSRIELLALIKSFNRVQNDKIKNSDKMKKNELLSLCKSLSLIELSSLPSKHINLQNLSKISIQQDIQLYFLKQGKEIPKHVLTMKKKELIDFMELNGIIHHTPELLEKETRKYIAENNAKNIVYYNMIKYDNVNTDEIDSNSIAEFIELHQLDQNILHFKEYAKLLHSIYTAYDTFCDETENERHNDRIKSFPKIIQHLQKIIEK